MKQVKLGSSGLMASEMGLGLAALGRPGYINMGHGHDIGAAYASHTMEAHAHAVLDAAWAAGIRYFDAARSYGQAEAFLASWLASRNVSPSDITIGSKWGYVYTAAWQVSAAEHEVKDHSLVNLQRQWQESLDLLGPFIRLYQIHSATLESGVLDDRTVMDELLRLKRTHGIALGLTVSGPRQEQIVRKAMSIRPDGRFLFDAVQVTFNLLERSTGALLRTAHDMGMGVIVKEALANGRLTSRNKEPGFKANRLRLRELAIEAGTSIDALALAAIMNEPWVDVVLSGAATVDQLLSNIGAVQVEWTNALRQQTRGFVEDTDSYWQKRSQLEWN